MSWFQKQFTLPSKSRGSYLVTDEVLKQLPEIKDYKVGLLNLFVQHTSCALSLNENWDEEVRCVLCCAVLCSPPLLTLSISALFLLPTPSPRSTEHRPKPLVLFAIRNTAANTNAAPARSQRRHVRRA